MYLSLSETLHYHSERSHCPSVSGARDSVSILLSFYFFFAHAAVIKEKIAQYPASNQTST